MTLPHTAYTAYVFGLTTKTGNEIHWKNAMGFPITVEIIDIEQGKYIVRSYWENNNKRWEISYQDDQKHGKSIGWYENGNKRFETNYQDDQRHGKSIGWYKNGNKKWEENYQNSQFHGKKIKWNENGNMLWEIDFQNGKLL